MLRSTDSNLVASKTCYLADIDSEFDSEFEGYPIAFNPFLPRKDDPMYLNTQPGLPGRRPET